MPESLTTTVLTEQQQTLRDRGICVIIPTYNNGGTIADVTERALRQCADVIVVCDGCTDQTLSVLDLLEVKPAIVELKKNGGKGNALREGFRYALSQGFSYAITIDGDGQHYPEDIPCMLKANQKHPGALIVGEGKALNQVDRSGGSKFANAFSNFWFAVQTGCFLKDTQTGYRLYPLKKLYGLSLLTSRYEAELELMVFASWHGVKLVSEPVNVYYPSREERVSHFRPGKDFARIAVLNTVLCFLALVYGLPLRLWRFLSTFLRSAYSLIFFLFFSVLVITPLTYLYLRIGKMTEKKKDNLHKILQFACRFILVKHGIPGVKYQEENPQHEDFVKPSVITCNHQSHLDLLSLLMQSPKIVVMTNDWAWHNAFYGYIIRNAEFLPASRGIDALMPQLQSLVERGYSIMVYPEGTRSKDCSIGRFHQGAYHIATTLGLDVLPLILYGTGKVLPKRGRHLNKGTICMAIDERISPESLSAMGENSMEQASAMRTYYKKRYSELCNKIEQDA